MVARSNNLYHSFKSRASVAHLDRQELRDWVREHFFDRCPCGAPGEAVDHKIPLARGGMNAIGNFQMLCGPCNAGKWMRMPQDGKSPDQHPLVFTPPRKKRRAK